MKHKESQIQQRCVSWFRYQYPAFKRLLFHPKNEGNGNRAQGAIAKAEGVVAGVADLLLTVPAQYSATYTTIGLALELKTKVGKQSPEQKLFEQFYTLAGGQYSIIRSYEDFVTIVTDYMAHVPEDIKQLIIEQHNDNERESLNKAKAEFQKLVAKQ
jgi:hypothetical protein